MSEKVDEKKMLNQALDYLDGLCAQMQIDRLGHARVQASIGLLRESVNKEEEPAKEIKSEEGT